MRLIQNEATNGYLGDRIKHVWNLQGKLKICGIETKELKPDVNLKGDKNTIAALIQIKEKLSVQSSLKWYLQGNNDMVDAFGMGTNDIAIGNMHTSRGNDKDSNNNNNNDNGKRNSILDKFDLIKERVTGTTPIKGQGSQLSSIPTSQDDDNNGNRTQGETNSGEIKGEPQVLIKESVNLDQLVLSSNNQSNNLDQLFQMSSNNQSYVAELELEGVDALA